MACPSTRRAQPASGAIRAGLWFLGKGQIAPQPLTLGPGRPCSPLEPRSPFGPAGPYNEDQIEMRVPDPISRQPFSVLNNYRWQGDHAISSSPHYLPDSIMSSMTMTQAYTTILYVPYQAEPMPTPQCRALLGKHAAPKQSHLQESLRTLACPVERRAP